MIFTICCSVLWALSTILPNACVHNDYCTFNVLFHSIQSYSKRRGLVAAQSPLESTRTDVWELIWQFKTKTVVLLCPLKEGKKVNLSLICVHDLQNVCT